MFFRRQWKYFERLMVVRWWYWWWFLVILHSKDNLTFSHPKILSLFFTKITFTFIVKTMFSLSVTWYVFGILSQPAGSPLKTFLIWTIFEKIKKKTTLIQYSTLWAYIWPCMRETFKRKNWKSNSTYQW